MGVLLQATFKRKGGLAVPCPHDGHTSIPWWWDHLARQASELSRSGFTAVLLPPVLKTSAGAFPGADGYGPFDDYDIGSKDQFFSVPTRFGSREQLQRCAAILRANGLDLYFDTVPHHRNGDPGNWEFKYLGANGVKDVGRFPKDKNCFFPNVPRDPIAGPIGDDFGFGRELCPVNAKPAGYVMNGLIDAGDWLTRALDAQGYRIDDTKGLAVEFVHRYLTSKAMAGKFAFGEYFDGNPQTLSWWVWNSGMEGRCATFDFSLRFMLAAMCNNNSRWDMTQLDHAGLAGISPTQAVTFIDNHDTDLSFPVIWNKMLGYAYILTSEGYPCVYYKDYSTDQGCYGLKPLLDNLIWIHEHLAEGPTQQRWKDFQCFVYERLGGAHLLVGLNNDMYNGWRTVSVQTGFGANVHLHDYTGHAGDVWTDASGSVTIGVPPNDNGLGYVCYSRVGLDGPNLTAGYSTTQVYEGAADLDIPPAENGKTVQVCRIWCDAGKDVVAVLNPNITGWTARTEITLRLLDAAGAVVAAHTYKGAPPPPADLRVTVWHAGWHSAQIAASGLPAPSGQSAYHLSLTYTATQQLAA